MLDEEPGNMLEEVPRDNFEMAKEVTDQVTSCIVVNSDEDWLGNYGFLAEEIMWEEEEVDTTAHYNFPIADEETSCPSTAPVTVPADRLYCPNSAEHILNQEHRLDTTMDVDTFSRDNLANAVGGDDEDDRSNPALYNALPRSR